MFRHKTRGIPALALVGLALSFIPGLHANSLNYVTFTFTGTCAANDLCVGQGVGSLVLTDYTLGSALNASNFVSFSYSSSYIPSMTITSASELSQFSGTISNNLPNPEAIDILTVSGEIFLSGTNGFWCTSTTAADCHNDMGTTSVWDVQRSLDTTDVPEPGSIAMGMIGIAALAMLRKKIGVSKP